MWSYSTRIMSQGEVGGVGFFPRFFVDPIRCAATARRDVQGLGGTTSSIGAATRQPKVKATSRR